MNNQTSSHDATSQTFLSAGKAVFVGHLLISIPALAIFSGIFFIGRAAAPQSTLLFLLIGVGLAGLWWAFTVPRWRRWALRRGAPRDRLQKLAALTGMVWPGWIFGKTEFEARDKITVEGYTFSPGELEWARENLDSMRRTVRNNTVLYLTMLLTFVLGLALYLLSDAVSTGAIALPTGWRADLVGDLLYNLGVVLWTSVVLVLFLEVIVEYQRRRWQRYLRLVERALQEQGRTPPSGDPAVSGDDDVSAKLDMILSQLAVVEKLQADVTDLKTRLESWPLK